MDTVLTVLIGLAVSAMAALGVYVSFVPMPPDDISKPFRRRRAFRVTVIFGLLTVITVSLSAYQTRRNDRQQDQNSQTLVKMQTVIATTQSQLQKATTLLQNTQASLQASALAQEYMKGQLSGLSMMVGKLDSDGNAGSANLAKVLHEIASEPRHNTGVEPPAIQRMTNKQLRDKTMDLVFSLRKEAYDFDTQEETESLHNRTQNPASREESMKQFQERNDQSVALRNSFNLRLQQNYVVDATDYENELIRRLGPQPPLGPESMSDFFWEGSVGYLAAIDTANYLEHLGVCLG